MHRIELFIYLLYCCVLFINFDLHDVTLKCDGKQLIGEINCVIGAIHCSVA